MSDPRKLPSGAVFELEGSWYLKVSDGGVRQISHDEATRRRTAAQTPRILPVEKPIQTGSSATAASGPSSYSYQNRHASDARGGDAKAATVKEPKPTTEAVARRQPIQQKVPNTAPEYYMTTSLRHDAPKETAQAMESGFKDLSISEPKPQTASKRSHGARSSEDEILSSTTDRKNSELKGKDSDNPEFSVLSGLPAYFCQISVEDYSKKAEFLATYPELLRTNLNNLFLEATQQMRNNNIEVAKQCISSLVIIRQCDNIKNRPELIEGRVSALNNPKAERAKLYRETFAAVEESIMNLVNKPDPVAQNQARDAANDELKGSHARRRESKQTTSSGYSTVNPIREIEKITADGKTLSPEDVLKELGEGLSDIISAVAAKAQSTIKLSPGDFAEGDLQTLSSRYRVYDKAATFFVPGRVFSLLWHDPAGRSYKKPQKGSTDDLTEPHDGYYNGRLSRNTTIGPYGEKIYSHIRRMIVVRSRSAYCWTIPIGTYGGLALKKRGLKKSEIDAHAIVYDSRSEPKYLPNEPKTVKMPIAIRLRSDQTLSEASRLHYGKPSTVEYNQPVLDCGMVLKEHLPILLSEVRSEMLEELPLIQS